MVKRTGIGPGILPPGDQVNKNTGDDKPCNAADNDPVIGNAGHHENGRTDQAAESRGLPHTARDKAREKLPQ